jgi:hypothetical protein
VDADGPGVGKAIDPEAFVIGWELEGAVMALEAAVCCLSEAAIVNPAATAWTKVAITNHTVNQIRTRSCFSVTRRSRIDRIVFAFSSGEEPPAIITSRRSASLLLFHPSFAPEGSIFDTLRYTKEKTRRENRGKPAARRVPAVVFDYLRVEGRAHSCQIQQWLYARVHMAM